MALGSPPESTPYVLSGKSTCHGKGKYALEIYTRCPKILSDVKSLYLLSGTSHQRIGRGVYTLHLVIHDTLVGQWLVLLLQLIVPSLLL